MELFNDHFQNFKRYNLPKAQLIIADIPYNLGKNAYGSNPKWYVDGDRKNGKSKLADTQFFDTDLNFNVPEFMHFASRMLKPEPKAKGQAPAMLVFCAFEQQMLLIDAARKAGFGGYINLVLRKRTSPQVLKANMRIVGNAEYALLFYRDKLPMFNNHGRMVMNIIDWPRDYRDVPKVHPTQKPVPLLEKFVDLFTNPGDVVIDPCAGSGSSLLAAENMQRKGYGFEIKKEFCQAFEEKMRPIGGATLPLWGV
ncbi:site-specific DNA-methyltransferase [Corynebacterium lizhenjunii]|uniref:Methyltransferase n=1 Tax=Corynebacterium lizhenjunii TaxID=2709394 RepID=A0A7T0KCK8_9CORY|nr:site-specific DNA-methyltransferase [Corynebacterium lizhenjunii]QPK78291.1 site-specific DNA-methyltransferase [Corynebacterium lizhenjunii]